jgi:hypothetical protein
MIRRLAFLATLFYASIMYHRHRRSTRYALIGKNDVPSTNLPQSNDIIVTSYDSQDPKSTYEPQERINEALSEPVQEIITSDNIAELPMTRD